MSYSSMANIFNSTYVGEEMVKVVFICIISSLVITLVIELW